LINHISSKWNSIRYNELVISDGCSRESSNNTENMNVNTRADGENTCRRSTGSSKIDSCEVMDTYIVIWILHEVSQQRHLCCC